MNILYDDNMPFAENYFAKFKHAKSFKAGALSASDLQECEALLVRSTTKVSAEIIQTSPKLKFVATATAGFDHLDTEALTKANIPWYAAGGCNANAVAEYVLAALYHLADKQRFSLQEKSIALVGVGNVGRALLEKLKVLGLRVFTYDPPRAAVDPNFESVPFEKVLSADIISLHVPLIKSDDPQSLFPTEHMFNEEVLASLRRDQILINACRGEVIDNNALFNLCSKDTIRQPTFVLDCWEHEPNINTRLIPYLAIATAHIAGHSVEGKARGTDMVYRAFCERFSLEPEYQLDAFLPVHKMSSASLERITEATGSKPLQTIVLESIKSMYDIENDDSFFRQRMAKSNAFADIRREYHIRREWDCARLPIQNTKVSFLLAQLGFSVVDTS